MWGYGTYLTICFPQTLNSSYATVYFTERHNNNDNNGIVLVQLTFIATLMSFVLILCDKCIIYYTIYSVMGNYD